MQLILLVYQFILNPFYKLKNNQGQPGSRHHILLLDDDTLIFGPKIGNLGTYQVVKSK